MHKVQALLLAALFASAALTAQAPDSAQAPAANTPAPAKRKFPVLPVPGGGDTLDPDGMGKPLDHPATKEEALKQSKERSDAIAELQSRRLAGQLALNPSQVARVRALLIERDDDLRKAFSPDAPGAKEHPLTAQDRQVKIQQSQQDTLTKIGALLTPRQKQVFDGILAHGREEKSRRAAILASHRAASPATAPPANSPAPATQPTTAPPARTTPSLPTTSPQSN